MKCYACNCELKETTSFCPRCGTKVLEARDGNVEVVESEKWVEQYNEEIQLKNQRNLEKRKLPTWIGCVLTIASQGLYFFEKHQTAIDTSFNNLLYTMISFVVLGGALACNIYLSKPYWTRFKKICSASLGVVNGFVWIFGWFSAFAALFAYALLFYFIVMLAIGLVVVAPFISLWEQLTKNRKGK